MKDVPDIDPAWRTATVVSLCLSMREAQDWSALPILADALQDAGCPEASDLLARLRGGSTDYASDAVLVACVMSGEAVGAVTRIENMLAAIGVPQDYDDGRRPGSLSFEEFMGAARESLRDGDGIHMGTNETYTDYDWSADGEFWRDYRLLTGDTAQGRYGPSCFFGCSC